MRRSFSAAIVKSVERIIAFLDYQSHCVPSVSITLSVLMAEEKKIRVRSATLDNSNRRRDLFFSYTFRASFVVVSSVNPRSRVSGKLSETSILAISHHDRLPILFSRLF